MSRRWFNSKLRGWLLRHCPEWFLLKVWTPFFERSERKYWAKNTEFKKF